jgi:hypothetical protein
MALPIFEVEPNYINLVTNQVKLGDTNSAVPGRLLGRVEAYEEAGASEYILDTVRFGYKLVFIDNKPPPSNFRENNRSALSKSFFLYEELLRLESLGCTKRVNSRPHIVNPCSIVYSKNGGVSWMPHFS